MRQLGLQATHKHTNEYVHARTTRENSSYMHARINTIIMRGGGSSSYICSEHQSQPPSGAANKKHAPRPGTHVKSSGIMTSVIKFPNVSSRIALRNERAGNMAGGGEAGCTL